MQWQLEFGLTASLGKQKGIIRFQIPIDRHSVERKNKDMVVFESALAALEFAGSEVAAACAHLVKNNICILGIVHEECCRFAVLCFLARQQSPRVSLEAKD
jgi:hypothetical protein